jgi:hypothetical protein
MRILFDEGTPWPLRSFLIGHDVSTAKREGWAGVENGFLIEAAETAGFDVIISTDKNIRYQQNISARKITILVLTRPQWPELKLIIANVVDAINTAIPGFYKEIP